MKKEEVEELRRKTEEACKRNAELRARLKQLKGEK